MTESVTFTAPCDRDGCARDCTWTQTREGGRAVVPAPHAPGGTAVVAVPSYTIHRPCEPQETR